MNTLALGLTKDQVKFRVRVIGGSDANTIMSGDTERVMRLWQEKRGLIDPEDLSNILPVQMGSFTEPLNRYWFTKTTGRVVTNDGEERLCMDYPFMACTLDGLTDDGATVYEAKHVSAFAKPDEILARYYPQLHHNMMTCGLKRAVLSVFFGTMKYETFEIAFDQNYADALLAAETDFWHSIEEGDFPVIAEAIKPPIDATRKIDMTGNNLWATLACEWSANKDAAKVFAATEKGIKTLVAEDAVEASGHGIIVKRAKNGALSIKEMKE